MPRTPKKPCSYPGCPNLTYGRYCEKHKTLEPADQKTVNEFYRTPQWQKVRRIYLNSHPLCVRCGKKADIVDHIVPIKDGGAMLDEENFQSLCWSCHSRKSVEDGSRFKRKVYSY